MSNVCNYAVKNNENSTLFHYINYVECDVNIVMYYYLLYSVPWTKRTWEPLVYLHDKYCWNYALIFDFSSFFEEKGGERSDY